MTVLQKLLKDVINMQDLTDGYETIPIVQFIDMLEYSITKDKTITLESIIMFQDALIEILEVSKDGDLKSKLFIDSYKSQIEDLKQQLKNAENENI